VAFPPTPDHVWDITTPADTQLANLGAADFRNLKDDVMQRMSLLSGTFANRPTPETVNATWGGSGFGLLYFSTDTKQVFQWNGSAWVDISASLPSGSGVSSSLLLSTFPGQTNAPADITQDTIWDYVLPANTLGASGGFKVVLNVTTSVSGGNAIFVWVSFGGTKYQVVLDNNPGTASHVEFWVLNKTTTTQGISFVTTKQAGANQVSITSAGIVDTTVNQHISVFCQKTLAGDTAAFFDGYIQRL
jgi:hypothetical protein